MPNLIPNPKYDPNKPTTTENQPYLFEKPEETVISSLTGQTAYQAAITSDSLMPVKPIEVPKYPEDTINYQGIIDGGMALTKGMPSAIPPDETQTLIDQLNQLLKGEAPTDLTKTYEEGYAAGIQPKEQELLTKQTAVKSAQGELDLLNAQLQSLTDEAKAIPIRLQQEVTGRGITAGGLAPIQTGQLRDVALRALPLQGQILATQAKVASAQGDYNTAQQALSLAQQKFDTLFKLKSDDEERKYNYRKDMRDKIWDYLTKAEQNRIEELQKEDDRKFELLKDNLKNAQAIAKQAMENGQADIAAQITQLDSKSDTFTQDLARLQGQITIQPEKWSEAYLMAGDWVQKNLKTGEIRTAVNVPQAPKPTASETRDATVSTYLQASKGTDGFVSAGTYQNALTKFIAGGGNQSNFVAAYPQQTYLRQQEIDKLPASLKPKKPTGTDLEELSNALMNL